MPKSRNRNVMKVVNSTPAKWPLSYWFLIGLGGLVISTTLLRILTQRSESGAQTTTDQLSYLSTCNSTFWQVQERSFYSKIFNEKIELSITPAQVGDTTLKAKQLNVASKISTLLDKLRNESQCMLGCNYIDFILSDSNFKINVVERLEGNQCGAYRPTEHAVRVDLSVLQTRDTEIKKILLHEFWHAYKALVHTHFKNPAKLDITAMTQPGTPHHRDAVDATSRRREVQSSIDRGDNNIINDFSSLLDKEKSRLPMSSKDSMRLKQYKETAKTYSPKYQEGHINPTNFNAIKSSLKRAIDSGDVYKYTFKRGAHELVMYLDHYEVLPNGGAIISGYSTPHKGDTATALINDTKHRKYNAPHIIRAEGRAYMGTMEDTILTEMDAHIMENGETVNNVFYPELLAFHRCEHNEAFPESAPSTNIFYKR